MLCPLATNLRRLALCFLKILFQRGKWNIDNQHFRQMLFVLSVRTLPARQTLWAMNFWS